MLIILTRPPNILFPDCGTYYLKYLARKILRKTRGPEGVLLSLKRGLDQLGFSYKVNVKPNTGDTVHVLSNISALRYAIEQKQKGTISQLIAGPNLVVMPDEHKKILVASEIDKILTVSPWVQDLYNQVLPEINTKLYLWPAGVQILEKSDKFLQPLSPSCLVFKKNVPEPIYKKVIQTLQIKNISYTIFEYGNFKQKEYFDALEKHNFMIYLQEFESQGIALQEAWARDVPTLVWNKEIYTSPAGHRILGNIAAPFLTAQSGILFNDEDTKDFDKILESFIAKMKSDNPFTPRKYCIDHLSDKASMQVYLDIINKVQ